MANLAGKSIGRYHIIEQLGQGGMAIVYRAYDTRLKREVAVKLIRRDMVSPAVAEEMLKRFEREAVALAQLSHPNIVNIYDYGEHEGSPYLVMEFIDGGTLKTKTGNPLPMEDAARLLLPIARALAYAHERKLVHRDVKPANILLTSEGVPKLTDFGIAKILTPGDGAAPLTGTGVGIGTPEYMAPEQGMGLIVDHRADIYSLGIVLYELVTGQKPFRADTPMAVVVKQIQDPLPRPRQFVPAISAEAEQVLFTALAKKPDDRFPNMKTFAAALEKSGFVPQNAEAAGATVVEQGILKTVPRPPTGTTIIDPAYVRPVVETPTDIDLTPGGRLGGYPPGTSHTSAAMKGQTIRGLQPAAKKPVPGWLIAAGVAVFLLLCTVITGTMAYVGGWWYDIFPGPTRTATQLLPTSPVALLPTPGQSTLPATAQPSAMPGTATRPADATRAVTPFPTLTDIFTPTITLTLTPSLTPIPCNRAEFVADVNYPDGAQVPANASFTKIWRLKNTGSCAWTSGYQLYWAGGERMNAPDFVALTGGVINPGSSVDASVPLKAPAVPGAYQANFRLRAPDGTSFGLGASNTPFYARIVVPEPTPTPTRTPTKTPFILIIQRPDLTITDISFSPSPPVQGQVTTIKVSVYNEGNYQAGAFTVKWWASETAPSPACSWALASMVAKGGQVLSCTYKYPSWYASIVTKATADTENTVNESDETNNTRKETISVSKP